MTAPPISPQALAAHCRAARFAAGDVLRRQGHHYWDMYVVAEGEVEIDIAGASAARTLVLGAVTPIGEIGFLNGCPATATVTAKTPVSALVIDDATLWRIEEEDPSLAVALSRFLARHSEARVTANAALFSMHGAARRGSAVEVHLCRNEEMLRQAARLRYQVYCEELGRNSPYADHEQKTIRDKFDDFGHTFIAVEDGDVIGTLRGNRPTEGALGTLEDHYGMRSSAHYPERIGVVSKFVIRRGKRRGPAALKLISALTRYGLRHGSREVYVDCVPALIPYYRALGFEPAGEAFHHYEHGTSVPLRLDLEKHGGWLCREPGLRQHLTLYLRLRIFRWVEKLYPARLAGGKLGAGDVHTA